MVSNRYLGSLQSDKARTFRVDRVACECRSQATPSTAWLDQSPRRLAEAPNSQTSVALPGTSPSADSFVRSMR